MPVWDAYLSVSDRARQESLPPRVPAAPGRAVLLSVDNYRGAIGDERLPIERSVGDWPSSTGLAGWDALERVAELLAACRRSGVPVVHVVGVAAETSGVPTWRSGGGGRRGRPPVEDAAARDRLARSHDLVQQAAPLPGEPVLPKSAPSAFFGTALAALLVSLRCTHVIVVGQSTSGCVRATVVDAASHRWSVLVPEECVYDRSEASHAVNLFDMHDKYADVVALEHLLDRLEQYRA